VRIRRILFELPIAVACLAAGSAPTKAGAFLAPPGHGEIIVASSFSKSTRAFDAHGRLVPIPAYRKFELGTYIEYGLTDRVTLIAQPEADLVHQASVQAAPPAAAGTDLGARFGLANFGATVVSLQAVAHVPFTKGSQQAGFFDQDRVPAMDLRLLLGHGFSIGTKTGFLDIEASHRWQGDGLPDEWHADVTLGLRPIPPLLIMLASFMTIAGHAKSACASWSWVKLQPSVTYDLTRHWSVEAGFFATVAGQNAGRELGSLAALWYRF
jgi:hypothetical protein